MAARRGDGGVVRLCLIALVLASIGADAQLSTTFYDDTCPQIFDIVRSQVEAAVAAETRMAASLIRLHFHDCFVNGCDGSLLLNSTSTMLSEKEAIPNKNSVRGFFVIDNIKNALEAACPQTVSCADILALASRDSAVVGGLVPGYAVFLGRRDGLVANFSLANTTGLPSPFMFYPTLKAIFENVGLDEVDLVALSGAHTIGNTQCQFALAGTNDTNTLASPAFQQQTRDLCGTVLSNSTIFLDRSTPVTFDNFYHRNLLAGNGTLRSDQTLWGNSGQVGKEKVAEFAFDMFSFFDQFGKSSINMGNIAPLTGNEGEIRLNCALVNTPPSPPPPPCQSSRAGCVFSE